MKTKSKKTKKRTPAGQSRALAVAPGSAPVSRELQRSELWSKVYAASVASSDQFTRHFASICADRALREYDERFSEQKTAVEYAPQWGASASPEAIRAALLSPNGRDEPRAGSAATPKQ